MKFSTTTSSLLIATMAMSPSFSAAAPTGPASPKPAGTPNLRQFSASPLVDGSVTPSSLNRHRAFRTGGSGTPRKSIPSRLLKSRKRQNDQGPLANILDPVTSGNGILGSLFKTLSGLPVVGGILNGVLPGHASTPVQAATASGAPLLDPNSRLPLPDHLLDNVPLGTALSSSAGAPLGSLSSTVGGVAGGLVSGLPFNSNPLTGHNNPSSLHVGGIPSPLGIIFPSDPSSPNSDYRFPQRPSQPEIIQLPSGQLLVDIDGRWTEFPAGHHGIPGGDLFAAESLPVPPAAGQKSPPVGEAIPSSPSGQIAGPVHDHQIAPASFSPSPNSPPPPGVPGHLPSAPTSQIPSHPAPPAAPVTIPGQPAVQPPVAADAVSPPTSPPPIHPSHPAAPAAPPATPGNPPVQPPVAVSPPVSALPANPPTGSKVPDPPVHPTPPVQAPVPPAPINPAPAGVPTPPLSAADIDDEGDDPSRDLIHGMSAP